MKKLVNQNLKNYGENYISIPKGEYLLRETEDTEPLKAKIEKLNNEVEYHQSIIGKNQIIINECGKRLNSLKVTNNIEPVENYDNLVKELNNKISSAKSNISSAKSEIPAKNEAIKIIKNQIESVNLEFNTDIKNEIKEKAKAKFNNFISSLENAWEHIMPLLKELDTLGRNADNSNYLYSEFSKIVDFNNQMVEFKDQLVTQNKNRYGLIQKIDRM